MSGKIVAGYNPLLKVTIFQQHLTHTYTQIETGEGKKKKKRGLHRIVYCACKIYVLWSPAINTHCFSIKVRINPLILPPLEISLFFARQTGATKTFVCLFCSFPISSFPCCKIFILVFFFSTIVDVLNITDVHPQNFAPGSFLSCSVQDVCLAFESKTLHTHHAEHSRVPLRICKYPRPGEAKVKFFSVQLMEIQGSPVAKSVAIKPSRRLPILPFHYVVYFI